MCQEGEQRALNLDPNLHRRQKEEPERSRATCIVAKAEGVQPGGGTGMTAATGRSVLVAVCHAYYFQCTYLWMLPYFSIYSKGVPNV